MTPSDIRQWRETHGVGVRELARILDISPSTVIRWESGEMQNPGAMLDCALQWIAHQRRAERIEHEPPGE